MVVTDDGEIPHNLRNPLRGFENWLEASDRCQQADLDPVTAIKIIRTEVA